MSSFIDSRRKAAAALLISGLLGGCASHQPLPASQPSSTTHEIIWQRDLIFTPADAPQALAGDLVRPAGIGPWPGLLMVHGGGWSRRSREDMASSAERFAEAGFAVFNISHRFAPAYHFPEQVRDLQQAVRWMRTQAGELHLNPDWIAGYGYSSGAHLVAMLATLSPGSELHQPGTRLQAMVLGGAPTDLRRFRGGQLIPQFLGTDFENGFATYALASPVTHLSADDPPVFLYHGALDALVDADYAREFAVAATQFGVPNELYLAPLHGHVSMFLMRGSAERRAIAFLRGQVPAGPPAPGERR